MKKLIAALSLPILITACQSNGNDIKDINETHLQHHKWSLVQIDDTDIKGKPAPNLQLGEKMAANGHAGCNNFFGQAELKENQFRISKMGMTQKMCLKNMMQTEAIVASVLNDWSTIKLTKASLELKNEEHTLVFELTDLK